MELHEIETFIAVAQAESFSVGAERLGYSQAAVTIRIKNLEEELGVRLFDRLGKKISLTDKGELFYQQVIPVVNRLEDIYSQIKPGNLPEGHLSIGTIDSFATTIFPEVAQELMVSNPGMKISITTDTPQRLYEMLKTNELDILYLIDEKVQMKWAKVLYCEKEKIVMVADPKHKLSDNRRHTLSELANYPFMLTEENASYRKVLDEKLRECELEIEPVFVTDNTDLLLSVVRKSGQLTYLPKYTVNKYLQQGVLRSIEIEDMPDKIYRQVIVHKDKWINGEMRCFLDCLSRMI